MRRLMPFAALAAAAVLAPSALAQKPGSDPFVFVSDKEKDGSPADPSTLAWYLLPMTIRPDGTSVAGVSISAINRFRVQSVSSRPAISVEPWCFANALSDRSFVSVDRKVQAAIDDSFTRNRDHRFQLRGRFTGGPELLATVGHFQECDGGETGSFIILTNPATSPPRVVYVDVLPFVSGFQYMRLVDGDITVSTCFECGDVTGFFYDQRRRKFYWEALGD
jgi:hypothetical protein